MPSIDEIREVIAAVHWKASRGYENQSSGLQVAPHQYIVRQQQPTAFAFLRAAITNHPDSYTGKYGKWTYTYLNVDGWRYWSIQNILNRARLDEVAQDPNVQEVEGAPSS